MNTLGNIYLAPSLLNLGIVRVPSSRTSNEVGKGEREVRREVRRAVMGERSVKTQEGEVPRGKSRE